MNLEVLVVGASLDDPGARRFVERLGARYRVTAATAAPATAALATARGEAGGVELLRFATAAPAEKKEPGTLAGALARARARGPWSPELFEFLHHEGARYRAIVFLSYASPLTAFGLPLVPERAILLPLADGGDLTEAPYRALFHLPRAIGYRDDAERERVHAAARNEQVPYELFAIDGPDGETDAAFDRLLVAALHA